MNSACRVTSTLMKASAAGPATGTIVCSTVGSAVGIVCWVMFWARSAWLTCVMRTSCVLTTEMPIDPPMLRDRLSSAAAVVRIRGATSRMPGSAAARRSGRDRGPARRRS